MKYDFAAIEPKWQKIWADEKLFAAENGSKKPKYYVLVEFPYPSGAGLHVGHPRPYTAMDAIAQKNVCRGIMYCFRWGMTPSGCLQKTLPLKIMCIRQ